MLSCCTRRGVSTNTGPLWELLLELDPSRFPSPTGDTQAGWEAAACRMRNCSGHSNLISKVMFWKEVWMTLIIKAS